MNSIPKGKRKCEIISGKADLSDPSWNTDQGVQLHSKSLELNSQGEANASIQNFDSYVDVTR